MPSVGAIATLTLLAFAGSLSAEEAPTTSTTSTAAPTTTTATSLEGPSSDKIARRIIDDRLMPPRSTEFSHWHMRLPAAAGEVHRPNVHPQPPRVTEDIDDNVSDRGAPKKTRTVGPTQGEQCPFYALIPDSLLFSANHLSLRQFNEYKCFGNYHC